jgi:hypothetical protein
MERIIREAIETELSPNSISRENGFCLSKSWKLLICTLKDRRKTHPQDSIAWFSEGSIW